jgi:hypothetical protein
MHSMVMNRVNSEPQTIVLREAPGSAQAGSICVEINKSGDGKSTFTKADSDPTGRPSLEQLPSIVLRPSSCHRRSDPHRGLNRVCR